MDYSQFFHIECYSRKTSANSTNKKAHLKQVMFEASRKGFCNHVKQPKEPILIYGKDTIGLYEEILKTVATEKDSLNRKIREDTNLILAGVCSFPKPVLNCLTDKDLTKELSDWVILNKEFLKDKYKNTLKSIVFHMDETFPHLHFYCVNDKVSKARDLHDGYKAQDQIANNKKYEKDLAYRKAMKDLQDEYYESVSKKIGFLRVSEIPRPRMNKADYKKYLKKQKNIKLGLH